MPKRILLADDSITIQKVVELTFSDGDYEVVAVNNGAKAIQRLGEMRPDIILSDIIMPEKNGYEVCEYVKSHPELRNIPVILLTGTFEPFDPDRADKAGCDAVVTKPFESQSLIQKVEELISQAAPAAAAPAPPPVEPEPAPSPWDDTPVASSFEAPEPERSPFSTGTTHAGFTPTPFPANDNDIFGAPPAAPQPTTEMPFETGYGDAGETRAFPRMSFEELQQMSPAPEPAPAPEPESPWGGSSAPLSTGGETQAFPRVSFEDLQRASQQQPTSPWDEPPAAEPAYGGETRAFPMVSFEDLQASQPEPEPPAPEPSSPWDEPAAGTAMGGETRAFPRVSFEELQQIQSASAPAPASEPEPEPQQTSSLWDEQAAFQHEEIPAFPPEEPAMGGETRAFPRMSFEELQQMQAPAAEPAPVEEPEPAPEPVTSLWDEPAAPAWEPPAEEPAVETASPFSAPAQEEPALEEMPFAAGDEIESTDAEPVETVSEPAPAEEPAFQENAFQQAEYEEPVWASQPAPEPEPEEMPAPAAAAFETPDSGSFEAPAAAVRMGTGAGELTDEQIDRIARRVVELMSPDIVRNIAWEVIPDMAKIEVKERIRQLEAE